MLLSNRVLLQSRTLGLMFNWYILIKLIISGCITFLIRLCGVNIWVKTNRSRALSFVLCFFFHGFNDTYSLLDEAVKFNRNEAVLVNVSYVHIDFSTEKNSFVKIANWWKKIT